MGHYQEKNLKNLEGSHTTNRALLHIITYFIQMNIFYVNDFHSLSTPGVDPVYQSVVKYTQEEYYKASNMI